MKSFEKFVDQALDYCFYGIFFLVPLVMHPLTFELFEFNKMWVVFGFTLLVLFLWVTKIILSGHFFIRRTPLDIPLLAFTASQIISTIISIDPHVSLWGYYSRFNGGLLSTLSYVFLYYAFASTLFTPTVRGDTAGRAPESAHEGALAGGKVVAGPLNSLLSYKIILASLFSGIIVAAWGLPSHFGYDPTCFIFRGTLDVSCWTNSFQPTIRMFSTLGQPNWLAAYISIILFFSIAFSFKDFKREKSTSTTYYHPKHAKHHQAMTNHSGFSFTTWNYVYMALTFIFYLCLLFTGSQSGFLGFWVGVALFLLLYFSTLLYNTTRSNNLLKNKIFVYPSFLFFIILVTSFFIGVPVPQINKYNFENSGLKKLFTPPVAQTPANTTPQRAPQTQAAVGELGGSDSGKIRLIVWRGALEIFKQNPLFGSGVETFAFTYYSVKPKEHNLTSEWDFLYNKAHNEYLNYLATTGAFGLGTYLLLIGWFLFLAIKTIIKSQAKNVFSMSTLLLLLALVASYISIIVSNFFGFSVVITNLYFFLIPILFFEIAGFDLRKCLISFRFAKVKQIPEQKQYLKKIYKVDDRSNILSAGQLIGIFMIGLIVLIGEFMLYRFWDADLKYAYGYNLDRVQQFGPANTPLLQAVAERGDEDIFKDELSLNMATISLLLAQQNRAVEATNYMIQAKQLSDEVVRKHPRNVVFFKTRTRVLYSLAQIDKKYLPEAIASLEQGMILAPTDAKIVYNLALVYLAEGNRDKAIALLDKSLDLKPNYTDANLAKAKILSDQARELVKTDRARAENLKEKARTILDYILKNLDPNNKDAKDLYNSLK